jgi:hypothetical protein
LRDVLRVHGTGPTFALCAHSEILRVWVKDNEAARWKQLPLKASIAAVEASDVLLAAHGEQVALYAPSSGLRLSTSSGLDFHSVPGLRDVIGMIYDSSGALIVVQAPPSSDELVVAQVDTESLTALRVADISGPREEEPELDALVSVGPCVYAMGNFGLVRLSRAPAEA